MSLLFLLEKGLKGVKSTYLHIIHYMLYIDYKICEYRYFLYIIFLESRITLGRFLEDSRKKYLHKHTVWAPSKKYQNVMTTEP